MKFFYNFLTGEIELQNVETQFLEDGAGADLNNRQTGDVELSMGNRTAGGEIDFGQR